VLVPDSRSGLWLSWTTGEQPWSMLDAERGYGRR
jgi:hypothetical protein